MFVGWTASPFTWELLHFWELSSKTSQCFFFFCQIKFFYFWKILQLFFHLFCRSEQLWHSFSNGFVQVSRGAAASILGLKHIFINDSLNPFDLWLLPWSSWAQKTPQQDGEIQESHSCQRWMWCLESRSLMRVIIDRLRRRRGRQKRGGGRGENQNVWLACSVLRLLCVWNWVPFAW